MYCINLAVVRPIYLSLLSGYSHQNLINEFLYFQFFSQAPIFLIGIWLYKFLLESNKSYLPPLALGAIWLAAAAFLKFGFGVNSSPFFWFAVVLLVVAAHGILSLQISWRPLNRLGEHSYSIYLTHFAIVDGIVLAFKEVSIERLDTWTYALALMLTLCCCLVVAGFLAVTVERWSSALGSYLVRLLADKPESRSLTTPKQ